MIITKTPMRISFLGGGTDYPESISKWGGMCIGTAINKHSYITLRHLPKFFDYNIRLMYSKTEITKSVDTIEHNVIRECLKYCGFNRGDIEMCHMSDLPSNSGTGSSSTFTVGLLNALHTLRGERLNPVDLFYKALEIEQGRLHECVGCQDQAWASFGGMNCFEFSRNGKLEVNRIVMNGNELKEFNNSLMMFYTKIPRQSSEIASSYVPTLHDKESEHLELISLTKRGLSAIQGRHYSSLGKLMAESWKIKKSLSNKVTNSVIDDIYSTAIDAGAYGGKLMGAGGGGCLVLVAPYYRHQHILDAIGDKALHIKFDFEPHGSQVILGDKNGY